MAHLKTLDTANNEQQRFQWKLNLVKMLYYKGYSREDIVALFKFIDWLLMLPKGLEKDFKNELKTFEEEQKMAYVTSIERLGREEGREEGMKEGLQQGELLNKQKVLRKQLSQKFGITEEESDIISNQENPELLDKAIDEIIFASSKEEVLKHLKEDI